MNSYKFFRFLAAWINTSKNNLRTYRLLIVKIYYISIKYSKSYLSLTYVLLDWEWCYLTLHQILNSINLDMMSLSKYSKSKLKSFFDYIYFLKCLFRNKGEISMIIDFKRDSKYTLIIYGSPCYMTVIKKSVWRLNGDV